MTNVDSDSTGHDINVTGQLLSFPVILVYIYAPNSDNPAFFQTFFSLTKHNITPFYPWW